MNNLLRGLLFLVLIGFFNDSFCQESFDFSEEEILSRLKKDVYTLASEEMEGREAGTAGEKLAADYIGKKMEEAGLEPLFEGSYFQEFTFTGDWIVSEGNYLTVAGQVFFHDESFYLLPVSGNAANQALAVKVEMEITDTANVTLNNDNKDLEGKFLITEYYIPEDKEESLGISQYQIMQMKVNKAVENEASGVIFINSDKQRPDPAIRLRGDHQRFDIPVIFAEQEIMAAIEKRPASKIVINTQMERDTVSAINVAGYWDNNASTTVVIGGHYDHLGWGGNGSRSPSEHSIHYGADDNASGIAGVLEAARYLTTSDLKSNNYIFIAFSAEEKGLIGSRHFTNSHAYDMEKINYMFNFDMIGRLENNSLSLIGTGTSPLWDVVIDNTKPVEFNISKNKTGIGASDHSAFYLEEIPVLFFFTGVHDDYHRPGDSPDKINYKGMEQIVSFSLEMVEYLDKEDPLVFTSTPLPDNRSRRMQGVTLGLMPDHAFDGIGLRIQAVVEGRPAQKAGLKDGDVIIRINDMEVREIYSYMETLGKLKKGEKALVVVNRDGKEIEFKVNL